MNFWGLLSDWKHILILDPLIIGAVTSGALMGLGLTIWVTKKKLWGYLWREWFTTVDHKKIGVMYILVALLMLVRGGIDALMMRLQLAFPEMEFLSSQHYNEVFTTHGIIMILFMAMPFLFGIINIVVPLQIGARDVAFPYLNAISFWLTVAGALLLNISFFVGGSPDAGWTSYFPLAGNEYSTTVGSNYYSISLQIAGLGTLISGVNFIVTIIKMRAPGMKLFMMPMFTWSILITCIIILASFPVLTVALAMMMFDRLFDAQFFTMANGGIDMMWANLFWIWGHPEVYIVILPAFGIYSDIITTFSKKMLYGYKAMVWSMIIISVLSMVVWVHHFYTMGQNVAVNSFFSITTMAISVPTGIKLFNWLFTLRKGRIELTTAMLYTLAFIPTFTIGGVTGVMLAMASADFIYHNTMFLVAHFHYTLIPGVVYAVLAGLYYWFPKIYGFKLNERLGKISFWFIAIFFNVTFFPLFFLGLDGMTRRTYTYSEGTGFGPLNLVASLGAVGMTIGVLVLLYNFYWSFRYAPRESEGDSWENGRTLEWMTPTPVPVYNFAVIPTVNRMDAYWYMKKDGSINEPVVYEDIHMPNNDWKPIVSGGFFFIAGFFLVFKAYIPAIIFSLPIFALLVMRSFQRDKGYYIPAHEVEETEKRLGSYRGKTTSADIS